MSEYKKSNYQALGAITLRTDKETGEPILDKNGNKQYTLLIDKSANVTINGKKISSKYLTVESPKAKFERMLSAGKISEDDFLAKTSRFDQDGDLSYIKFEVTAKLDA